MDSALRQRIVLVRATFEAARAKTGTGFRLAPGRVLTSQHVVQEVLESGEVRAADKIEVVVDLDGKTPADASATLLWCGEEKLEPKNLNATDVALLQDGLPTGDLQPFTDFVWQPLSSVAWDTAGFASASPGKGILRPDELSGDAGTIKSDEVYLELRIHRPAPTAKTKEGKRVGWSGVSGAPVFVAEGYHRGYLYGVIRKDPGSLPDTLYAVAIPHLLRDETFRGHLGIEDAPAKQAEIVTQLRILFQRQKKLAECTAQAHKEWGRMWRGSGVDGLLKAMTYRGSLSTILDELQPLYKDFAGRDSQSTADCRQASMLLASLITGRTLKCQSEDASGSRLDMAIASPNFAELGVASRDGRPADFIEVPGDLPRARLRAPLTTNLDSGIGLDQKERDHDELLEHYLFNVLNCGPWIFPTSVKALEGLPPGKKLEQWVKTIRLRLGRITRDRGGAPYIVVDPIYRDAFGQHAAAFLEILKTKFPELRQVHLIGDTDNRPKEDDQLEPLWNILNLLPEEDQR